MGLLFILGMLISYLLLFAGRLMKRVPALRYSNFVLRWWSKIWAFMIGLRFRRNGWKNEFGARTMVMVTNHNSYLDTVISYVNIRSAFRTLAKKELLRVPVMGAIFKSSGIMVDRSSPESRKLSFENMVACVEAGESVLVFPEGTQNRTDQILQPFYEGAFKLAIATQVPLLPIITLNSRRLMPQAKFGKMRPGTIEQYFLEPIETKGMTMADLTELSDLVWRMMESQIRELDPRYLQP